MRYFLILFLLPSYLFGQTATDYLIKAEQAEIAGNVSQALIFYNKAIELRTQSPKAYIAQGELIGKTAEVLQEDWHSKYLFDNQDYTNALASFDQAIQLDTSNYLAHYARGYLNMTYQKPELAINDFTNVLARTNDVHIVCSSLNQRGLAKMQAQYYESATDDFYKALDLADKSLIFIIILRFYTAV